MPNMFRDELVALVLFLAALAALCTMAALYGTDVANAIGLRDITVGAFGAVIALLTKAGVNIASDKTAVTTDDRQEQTTNIP